MPLVNLFLWIMLVLSAIVAYQIITAYAYAEQQAKHSIQPSYSENQRERSVPKRPVIVAANGNGRNSFSNDDNPGIRPFSFLSIEDQAANNNPVYSKLEFSLPRSAARNDKKYAEEMAANSDCHHCA